MKKIGILFGQENTFPQAFVDRINRKNPSGIFAEFVTLDKVIQGQASEYAVILDRISQDVPFYRAFLKNAAATGTAVINNPFWWSADDKFFNNALAEQINVQVPRTALLPSYQHPDNTTDKSFRNLIYPLDWVSIFDYVGFPAYLKPFDGGGWRNVYRLANKEEFYKVHQETGQLVMMLQEEIDFHAYYRCYCIGGKAVHIMPYNPRHPHQERYKASFEIDKTVLAEIERATIALNQYLGYDFNTVEFAVKGDVPYAIDFCNPAPDADIHSIGPENFEWIVETSAQYAIERAMAQDWSKDNLTWGKFISPGILKKNSTE
ncbi:RimK family alpha-L-glutamate ligase [Chitinophaga sp. Hz27]|uniref:ATP-grasp domain-containing protein n=1 Tax=Chitinophaga sp. Hz27 TaxID=3347169 RepID=UPI0035DB9D8B